jgi:carboxypeptidase T
MRRSRLLRVTVALGAVLAVTTATRIPTALAEPSPATSRVPAATTQQLFVYRVPTSTPADADRLTRAGFDLLEARAGADLFVLGTAGTAADLRRAGFVPAVAETLRPLHWQAPSTRLVPNAPRPALAPIDETYYGGYPTVRAHLAHLDKVAADRPDLATVVDYGDSYLKTRNPATGYDLKAICLTRKRAGDCALNPNAPKPRFLFMTQIHAREIITGAIAWRFIDRLVADYGRDAEVTALLDGTEVWVVPIVNPDGVDVVQQGGNRPYLQRKNVNPSAGRCSNPPTAFSQTGVDLNRNTSNHWGQAGTSSAPCSQTFPGARGDSEPETQGINGLFRSLFRDQRGPNDNDAAPPTTRGAMISMHSTAGMNLFPWGWSNRDTANHAALRAIAERMRGFNRYQTGQPGEILYNASGTSDDWTYGELGIASFTIEARSCNSFTPSYSCVTTDFNANFGALMYVAKSAAAPYRTALGPTVAVAATSGRQGAPARLSATVDDAGFGPAGAGAFRTAVLPVAAAEYSVSRPAPAGTGRAMQLSGSGTSVTAAATLTGLAPGRHLVFVRGKDSAGSWGQPAAGWITVS